MLDAAEFLDILRQRGGQAGQLIAGLAWRHTPLGDVCAWPQSLRTTLLTLLASSVPIVLLWGEDGVMLYNDAYSGFAGRRHPALLGSNVREGWPEVAAFNDHVMREVLAGRALAYRDQELTLQRHGRPESVWMNLDYSPVLDECGTPAGVIALVVETTQAVLADRRLRASEGRLRGVLDGMAEGFTLIDHDFRIVAVNDEALRMDGRGREEVVGKLCWDAYRGAGMAELGALCRRAMAGGEPASAEHSQTLANGRILWLDVRVYPVPEGLAVFSRDVTDRRLVEDAARQSAERVDLALNAGPILGTWSWELPADRFTADDRFARTFGMDPALCRTGVPLEQVVASVHPDDRPGLMGRIADTIEHGGTYRHEYRVLQWDGVYRWVEASGRIDRDEAGTPVRFPGVMLDIEARHAAEAERDSAMALLRTVVEAMPGVVYAKDRQGRMLVANAGTAALVGRAPHEFVGKTDAEFLDDPDQAAGVMATDRRIMESGAAEQIEEPVSLADGTPAVWLSTKVPLRDPAGVVIGLVGSSVDITARKQAEAVLARDKAGLERLVEERTRVLEETQQRLAHIQRMEALGQLAGGIAHDFNNVIQAVQSGATLIGRRPHDTDHVGRMARIIAEAAVRGAAVTRRLLAFSRRGDLRAEAIEPHALLAGVGEILSHTLGAGIAVRVEADPGLPAMLVDKGQLETVLVNLAANSRDAMPGGGQLTMAAFLHSVPAERDDAGARSPALRPGAYIGIVVTDTGIGMTQEVLARAAEPFFTTKEVGRGTGLGLAMARGFAEQSGGTLHIESRPGAGTTIAMWYPVAGAESASARAPVGTPASHGTGTAAPGRALTLMVVDDEALVRGVIAEQLRHAGYMVVTADSGADALAAEELGGPIDLLISDLSMPGMDGIALIAALQRRRPGLPAILLTGFATHAAESAMTQATKEAFLLLRKPVTEDELLARVAMLLDRAMVAAAV